MKILVVDDDFATRKLIEIIFTPKYKVFCAETCAEGLEIAVEYQPDLMILDLEFPDVENGFEKCREMKKDERVKNIPIIIIAEKGLTDKEELKGLKLGAEDYIKKPFDNNVLKERIEKVFERKKELNKAYKGITIGNIYLQNDPPIMYVEKKKIQLTLKEHSFLYILLRELGRVIKYKQFYKDIWGYNNDSLKKPLTRIAERVRNKLGSHHKDIIKTIKNEGYMLDKIK